MIEPTKLGIRNDPMGFGHFGAPRGGRIHEGVDYECIPGQDIRAPVSGKIRSHGPYVNDTSYSGFQITNKGMVVRVYYCKLVPGFSGKYVNEGDVVAKAQDISKKYNKPTTPESARMKPHVHLEIEAIDPLIIINLSRAMKGVEL